MAVPETTETRCKDDNVQARELHEDIARTPIPTSFLASQRYLFPVVT